tara:strand:- start:1706 stop:2194 length:489 start_codon:yes stop_codon:yes gene_type:complete
MPMTTSSLNVNMDTAGSSAPLLSEILTKVNNAKDKTKKIQVLRDNDSVPLRQVLKGAFDPNIKWDLPAGVPPYKKNDAPAGTEHTTLHQEARRLWHFVKGADEKLSKTRKEVMFIQVLEGLQEDEAELLINVKEKSLNKVYKGLTDAVVKEAFGWNEDYKTS